MKTWRLTIIPIIVICGGIWFEGCSSHKVTEPEARKRATAGFEHDCTMPYTGTPMKLYYHTNEFIGPKLNVGTGDKKGELCYQYVWTHKTANYEVVIGVTE